jgi:hypothetical protein
MADNYLIDVGDDTEGHAKGFKFVPEGDDEWLTRLLESKSEIRIRASGDDEDDSEGHKAGATSFRVIVDTDDDTEGHAISIHFPSREEADDFRKRLLLTGVLAGTVALGAAGGIGLANMPSDSATVQSASAGSAWTQDERAGLAAAAAADTSAGSAWTQDERAGVGTAAAQTGPMDVHEAPAFAAGAAASDATGVTASDAGPIDPAEAGTYSAYGSAAAAGAASQAGPMDPAEAGTYSAGSAAGVTASDAGPIDPAEAGTYSAYGSAAAAGAASQAGPMDPAEAGTYSTSASTDDEETEGTGGPQPR